MGYLTIIRHTLNSFLSNPTWDVLLLLFFFFAVFVYGMIIGRNKIIVLLLASYPAALINGYLPYSGSFLNRLNDYQNLFVKAFTFFVLTLFIFWVLNKSGFSRRELNKKTGQVLFLSFLSVGLWANILFGYVSLMNSEFLELAPVTQLLFGSDLAHFIWFVIPILILYWFTRP